MLEKLGFDVTVDYNGEQILKTPSKITDMYDYILINPEVPESKAMNLLEKIHQSNKKVKIIIVGNADEENAEKKSLEKGFTGSIKKPFKMLEIIDVIKGLV